MRLARSQWLFVVLTALVLSGGPALGQFTKLAPEPTPPAVLEKVGIDQHLGVQVPPELVFRDESGQEVRLGDYMGRKPLVLTIVYYECPGLCTMILNGTVKSLKTLNLDIGKDFDVVTVSFDPREKPELAAAKKAQYLKEYNRAGAEQGWHFLTGEQASIDALTKTVGFRYTWDDNTQQFAHAAAIMVLTPDGTLSRYLYGLEYGPRDLRLGLVEASEGKIGSLADQILLLCYHYNPLTGRYGFAVTMALRIAATVTLLLIGGTIFVLVRRERRRRRERAAGAEAVRK